MVIYKPGETWSVRPCPDPSFKLMVSRPPCRFHRWMQRALFGFRWSLECRGGVMVTLELLSELCPMTPRARLGLFVQPLSAAMAEFGIDTPARAAAFLAQIAHESDAFRYVREIASGHLYEGNMHLGNTQPGDGPRFKGRGLVQITGRKNYGLVGEALRLPLLEHPELLETPAYACRSAAWFWAVGAGLNLSKRALAHGVAANVNLNELADRGDFEGITLAINGGLNGQDDRLAYLRRAQASAAPGEVAA